jgi:hypothetical protein
VTFLEKRARRFLGLPDSRFLTPDEQERVKRVVWGLKREMGKPKRKDKPKNAGDFTDRILERIERPL